MTSNVRGVKLQRGAFGGRRHLRVVSGERRHGLRRDSRAQREGGQTRLATRRKRSLQGCILMMRRLISDACVRLGWDVFETALCRYTADFLEKVFPEEFFHGLVEAEHLWRADLPMQLEAAVYDTNLERSVRFSSHLGEYLCQLTWSSIAVLSRSTCSSLSEWRVT